MERFDADSNRRTLIELQGGNKVTFLQTQWVFLQASKLGAPGTKHRKQQPKRS